MLIKKLKKYSNILNCKDNTKKLKQKIYIYLKFTSKNILFIVQKNKNTILFQTSFKNMHFSNKSLYNKLNFKEFILYIEKKIKFYKIRYITKIIIINGSINQHLNFFFYFFKKLKKIVRYIYMLNFKLKVSYNGCKLSKVKKKKKKFKSFFHHKKNNIKSLNRTSVINVSLN